MLDSSKVKLPREIVEAVKGVFHLNEPFMREKQFHGIIHMQRDEPCTPEQATIYNYFYEKGWLLLAQSLINGWEVEQTPEDKVRELFRVEGENDEIGSKTASWILTGALKVLEAYNIKIKGVNDHE